MSSFTFDAEREIDASADPGQKAIALALLGCCERLDRIAGALEPDVAIATDEPSRELLAEAADDARILAQHRGDDADAEKYGALWRQLAGVREGEDGEERAARENLAGEALAGKLEAALTAARESLPIERLRKALHRGLGPVSVGVTGEPPREEEIDRRCGAPLLDQVTHPGVRRGLLALCFLQEGHHGSHRSEQGHIWQ